MALTHKLNSPILPVTENQLFIHHRLLRKLDELPKSYPSTESGMELHIFSKIFTPEDDETALQMTPLPETVEAAAMLVGY